MLLTAEWGEVLHLLVESEPLPEKYRDHALTGNWSGFRECHIKPDFLLIYEQKDDLIVITRLGSHSDLFG